MDFHTAAVTLRSMSITIMLVCGGLRATRLVHTDALLIAVALGLAMLASAAIFTDNLCAFAWLFTGSVLSVLALQGTYGMLPHPLRAYRKMRHHR